MKTIKQLTLEDVKKMGAAAEAEAQEQGWAVSVAIADAGGHLLWFQRGDGAPAMSATIAPDKARTSAISGRVSQDLEDMVNNGRTAAVSMPIVPPGSGLPMIVDGVVMGGIGVSGAQRHHDRQVAEAVVKALDQSRCLGQSYKGRVGAQHTCFHGFSLKRCPAVSHAY